MPISIFKTFFLVLLSINPLLFWKNWMTINWILIQCLTAFRNKMICEFNLNTPFLVLRSKMPNDWIFNQCLLLRIKRHYDINSFDSLLRLKTDTTHFHMSANDPFIFEELKCYSHNSSFSLFKDLKCQSALIFTCSKSTIDTLKKVWNRFKVNNKNTITTSFTCFWCVFIVNIPFSIVSIVEFEEVNVSLNDFKYRQIIPSRLNDWYIIVWQTPPLQTNDKCYPAVILITLYIVQSTTL